MANVPCGSCAFVATNQAVQKLPAMDAVQMVLLGAWTSNGGLPGHIPLSELPGDVGTIRKVGLPFFSEVVPLGSRRAGGGAAARPTTGAGPARPSSSSGAAIKE